jgi:hypothetical protein
MPAVKCLVMIRVLEIDIRCIPVLNEGLCGMHRDLTSSGSEYTIECDIDPG